MKKQKLELTWLGKDQHPNLEPRILIEDPEKSYGDPNAENILIHGDNLLALKALEQDFARKVKCIYIDPPYNTGAAFEHYEDGLEHSTWLSLMRDRLVILMNLLSVQGSIWISVDDNECHYLKVMLDELIGRHNFVATVIWQKIYTIKNSARHFSDMHDYVLVYAKEKEKWIRNLLPRSDKQDSAYSNPDDDPRGPWKATPLHARNPYSQGLYEITSPSGKKIKPPRGTYWRFSQSTLHKLMKNNQIWWGKNGESIPAQKRFLTDVKTGVVPSTLWTYQEAGHNAEAKNEIRALLTTGSEIFMTPKPEKLIKRIFELGTEPGDIVLDSFLGSGTTAAVAHKMGRRWIGVELGDHCQTHCLPRLQKVCDGTDQGGISKSIKWQGGGGFKYYELAPSLLNQDKHGNWVISQAYNADMLAAAMAKHEGFRYNPDSEMYWKQGRSSEKDYIFTTTNFIRVDFLDRIHEDMRENEHLLICCKKFSSACINRYPNIEVKKIPQMLLGRCEFGQDDYSLNIVNMPREPDAPEFVPKGPSESKPKGKKRIDPRQRTMF